MNLHLVRPPVAELVFQVYAKPLHPELFDILAAQTWQRDDWRIAVHITRSGHFIAWNNGNVFLAEIADIPSPEIFTSRRLLHYRLRGEHSASIECGRGVVYQTSFQVETVPPEIFLHVHDEILADGAKRGLLHNFQPNHRLAIAPLGFIAVESRSQCIFVNSFHTFPEESAIVKAQTLIERVD